MANRGATSAYLTALANRNIAQFNMVKIEFSSVLYLTDYTRNLSWSSQTWFANGMITGIPQIMGSMEMSMQLIDIEISGADLSILSTILSENYLNKKVLIYRGLCENTTDALVVDPVLVYSGSVDGFTFSENPTEDSTLKLQCSNHWATFKQRNGRRTNGYDQQHHYSGDTFFKYASEVIRSFEWLDNFTVNFGGERNS